MISKLKVLMYCFFYFGIIFPFNTFGTDTIPITVIPLDTIGMCRENNFSLSFEASGSHIFTINAELFRDTIADTTDYCGNPGNPKLLIVVDSTSAGSMTSELTDTLNGSWTANITDTGTVTIWYHIYIDCASSLRPGTTSIYNLDLVQTFTDSIGNFYDTGGNTNKFSSYNITNLRFLHVSDLDFITSYLDTTFLTFKYVNTAPGSGDIRFSFIPDLTGHCGMVTYQQSEYAIGNGFFTSFVPQTLSPIVHIDAGDTLVIRQMVVSDTCITFCDSAQVIFSWQCANMPTQDSIFCNSCNTPKYTSFNLLNGDSAVIAIERITPTLQEAIFDNTCFNDTAGMMNWHFRITNNGIGALDSVLIELNNGDTGDDIEFLSLIPDSSYSFQANCSTCVDNQATVPRVDYLCQSFVPNALKSATIELRNFRTTDTIDVFFSTFRCSSEDTGLFNVAKVMNNWVLKVMGKTICQDTAKFDLIGTPYHGILKEQQISGHVIGGYDDVTLNTNYTPVVTDLTVPQNSTFGQTATIEMEFNGGIKDHDRQVLGCLSQNCSVLHGYLKVTVLCDQGLVIRNPSTEAKIKKYNLGQNGYEYFDPIYYHTVVQADVCEEGSYSYYFNLSQPDFLNILDSGIFEFTLQSCCVPIEPAVYKVEFSILPDPNSCDSLNFPSGNTLPPNCLGFGCEWIPLRKTENSINVHCPGCRTPGMVVDNYLLRRTTFGLQDSDNDGFADSAAVLVNADPSWFNSHSIRTWNSTIGDELEDLLVSHFQEGDEVNDGYTYGQMLPLGARLNYLQLKREIPSGLDTMGLTPIDFTFYIDSPDTSNSNCIDCPFFNVDTNEYRTMLKLHVTNADTLFDLFVDTIFSENILLFTFESLFDSVLLHSGNLHDHISLFQHNDTITPFEGFFENQQYRLHVNYKQCNTLITSISTLDDQEDISIRSEIKNYMWLSGIKQAHDGYPNHEQPSDTAELHLEGWTFNALDSTKTLVDSVFANDYAFYCSGMGRNHYFYFQNVRPNGSIGIDTSCYRQINFGSVIHTRAGTIKAFPYEYRPTPLWPSQIDVLVPAGYFVSQARVRSNYISNIAGNSTAWRYFTPTPLTGQISMSNEIWMNPIIFYDQLFPLSLTDSNLYVMSERTEIRYEFLLTPDSCLMAPLFLPDSSIVINHKLTPLPHPFVPHDSLVCQPPTSVDFVYQQSNTPLILQPNLNGILPDTVTAQNHLVCFDLLVTNYTIPLDTPAINSTGAPYVFLGLPDSATIPFLQNWFFNTGTDTIYANGDIIELDTWLPSGNTTISGQVCAYYNPCQDKLIDIPFTIGWNCFDYPSSTLEVDSVCGHIPISVILQDEDVFVGTGDKDFPGEYTLCEPFEITTPFLAQENGGYIPQSIELDSLPTGLIPLYAFINNCNNDTIIDTLQFLNPNTWSITGNNLSFVGIPDSALNAPECIEITIGLLPLCEYSGNTNLPNMILHGHTFCGGAMRVNAPFPDTIEMNADTSFCNDCFTIEKTALQDSASVGDTVAFQIVVCGNNQYPDSVGIIDYIPLNFTLISFMPDSLYNIPAIGCDTLMVTGYYTAPGYCGDEFMINTATIYFHGDSLSASDCVEIYAPCATSADIILPDSSFATSYPSGFSGITVYVHGRFYVDTNFFYMQNCTILVNSGGQIIILPGASLVTDSSVFEGCDFMWRGFYLHSISALGIRNNSFVRDADTTIFANHRSSLKLLNSHFEDFVRGVYVPPSLGSINNIAQQIYGNHFGMVGSYKSPYPGQATIGSVPYSSIEVNDVIWQIGSTTLDSNYFHNSNTGIIGFRSALQVVNNKFDFIASDSTLGTSSDWDGSAIASIGILNSVSSKLVVEPVTSGDWTIERSERGVYTYISDLEIANVRMKGMNTGIFSTRCTAPMMSIVRDCHIEADKFGIDWRHNNGSTAMQAKSNSIYMVNALSIGILMRENSANSTANYVIENNYLEMEDGFVGIAGLNLFRTFVLDNQIKMSGNVTVLMTGIAFEGGLRNLISCNLINGDNDMDTTKIGITVNLSNQTNVLCNRVDSTGYGFHFGGQCFETSFKANTMNNHFNGLRLNSVAVIDTQSHAGNKWLGAFSDTLGNWGAINMNADSLFALQLSLFEVNPTPDPSLLPSTPNASSLPAWPDDNGWFVVLTNGDADSCEMYVTCVNGHQDPDVKRTSSDGLIRAIAADSTLTSAFIPESKSMAKSYLYEELKEDSSLIASYSSYEDFISTNQIGSIGNLYEAKKNIIIGSTIDSSDKAYIQNNQIILNLLIDSLFISDSLEILYPGSQSLIRENLLSSIESIKSTIEIELNSLEAAKISAINTASQINSSVQSNALPEQNEKIINEIEWQYQLQGKEQIVTHAFELLSIANQCPYKGGKAVYRARTLMSLINNQLIYDDLSECALQGIYRQAQSPIKPEQKISLIPNPADESVSIITYGFGEGICKLQIKNAVNQIIGLYSFNCTDKSYTIETSKLTPGIYTVHITVDNKNYTLEKLVIIR